MRLRAAASLSRVQNIRRGHGAFVHGSGCRPVCDILIEDRICLFVVGINSCRDRGLYNLRHPALIEMAGAMK